MLAIVSRYHEEISAASGLWSVPFLFLGVASFDRFGGRHSFRFSIVNLFVSVATFIVAPLDEDRPMPIVAAICRYGEI